MDVKPLLLEMKRIIFKLVPSWLWPHVLAMIDRPREACALEFTTTFGAHACLRCCDLARLWVFFVAEASRGVSSLTNKW